MPARHRNLSSETISDILDTESNFEMLHLDYKRDKSMKVIEIFDI